MRRAGKVVEDDQRRRGIIAEHLEWLAGRLPSEAVREERRQRLTALAVYMAVNKHRHAARKRRK